MFGQHACLSSGTARAYFQEQDTMLGWPINDSGQIIGSTRLAGICVAVGTDRWVGLAGLPVRGWQHEGPAACLATRHG